MLKQIEGSQGIAQAVALCRPEVICAYPISPQTHIVEGLSAIVKTGRLTPGEFVNVESARDLRRGHRRADRGQRPVRGAPLPVVRQLLRLRQLLRRVPRQRGDQDRPGGAYEYEIDLDFCKGCGICVEECPCGAIEMVPEAI